MEKELTVLEKAHKIIEAGLFAEDMVMCTDDFIDGAYEVFKYYELKPDLLNHVMLSDVDELEDCPSFDKCNNPLKDKHCDEHMEGSMYCFEK